MDRSIFVIDNSFVMRKTLIRTLSEKWNDIQFLEAENGEDAFNKKLDWKQIDLIVCDILMEKMDGLTFVKKLKEQNDIAHIPIIMITTEGSLEVMNQALSMGANDYIVKPFNIDELVNCISNYI